MGSGGALLVCSLFFLYVAHPGTSCSLITQLLCKREITQADGSQWCRGHLFRCTNSTLEIKFGGRGQWYRVVGEETLDCLNFEIEDPTLSHIFEHTDCDFLYMFPRPGPLFTPPQTSPNFSGDPQSYCDDVSDYSLLFSNLIKRYQQKGLCTSYDLYRVSKELLDLQHPAAPNRCLPAPDPPTLIWKLAINNNSDGTFTTIAGGFSRRYKPDPDCFKCAMTGVRCDSGSAGYSTCDIPHIASIGHTQISRQRKIILGISAGTSGFLLTCIMLCWWFQKKRGNLSPVWIMKSKNSQNIEAFLKQYGTIIPKRYGYAEVKKITKSFTEKLGQGGYALVFKGKLLDGQLVAAKVLKSKENAEEFINEVAIIGRTHHINIVRLLGFCCEGSKRALLYEFMPNGSLEKFIFLGKSEHAIHLGWEKLLEIAIGVGRGLEYLHRGCNTRIVHFDIKPHNILLDEDFCPKISDFGLAKSCRPKQSILSTVGARGTIGYIAPEVYSRNFGAISSKSDVYSYGMMVLEMVGGRASINVKANTTSDTYFPHWIYDHFNDSLALQLHGITNETEEVARKMILVGLWCIQTSPSSRPSISKAVEMLEGNCEDIEMPPKPYLCSLESSHIESCT